MTSEELKERVGKRLRFRVEGSPEVREGKVERLSQDERWVLVSGIGYEVSRMAEALKSDDVEVVSTGGGEHV